MQKIDSFVAKDTLNILYKICTQYCSNSLFGESTAVHLTRHSYVIMSLVNHTVTMRQIPSTLAVNFQMCV